MRFRFVTFFLAECMHSFICPQKIMECSTESNFEKVLAILAQILKLLRNPDSGHQVCNFKQCVHDCVVVSLA